MKRRLLTALIILLALILLFPMKIAYKDGGSVEYKAILYSVYKEHSLSPEPGYYNIGTVVTILGFEVYNDVQNSVPEPISKSS